MRRIEGFEDSLLDYDPDCLRDAKKLSSDLRGPPIKGSATVCTQHTNFATELSTHARGFF